MAIIGFLMTGREPAEVLAALFFPVSSKCNYVYLDLKTRKSMNNEYQTQLNRFLSLKN